MILILVNSLLFKKLPNNNHNVTSITINFELKHNIYLSHGVIANRIIYSFNALFYCQEHHNIA